MDKRHIPYNVVLIAAVVAVGLMAICNLTLRQSSFAVTVGYQIPQPVRAEAPQRQSAAPSAPLDAYSLAAAEALQYAGEPQSVDDGRIYSVQFPLELNDATYNQLLFIPRVGDVTAQRIIQYREHLGGYTSLSQLLEIKNIGDATYQHITAYLYLEDEYPEEEAVPESENDSEAELEWEEDDPEFYEEEDQYDPY